MSAATVDTPHPEYTRAQDAWRRCRDFRRGSDAVKAGKYLPRPQGLDDIAFKFYLERAQYFNATARTVQALAGAVLRQEPRVNAPEDMKDAFEDVTKRDESIEDVARIVLSEVLTVGRHALMLDVTAAGDPFWVLLDAECVINWRTGPVGDDPDQLLMVVIREERAVESEFGHETRCAYRQLALVDGKYQTRLWEKANDSKEYVPGPWIEPTRRGDPIDFIPFTFVSPEGVTADVCPPPLLDMVNVSLGHFTNSADHEHVLHWVACPTPWVAGAANANSPLMIGSSIAWSLEKEGRAGMLEHTGQGVGAIREAMQAKEMQMAHLGARLIEDSGTGADTTATAVRIRHAGDAAALSTIAAAAEAALSRMLRWHIWWASGGELSTEWEVELSQAFADIKATPEEIKTGLLAVQAGEMSQETFYALLERGGWARDGVSYEEERKAIEEEAAAREAAKPEPDPAEDPMAGDPTMDPGMEDPTGGQPRTPPGKPPAA